MRSTLARALAAVVAILATTVGHASVVAAAPFPSDGFEDALVTDLPAPTALAFTPDGSLVMATQGGQIWVKDTVESDPTIALDISSKVCREVDQGMLGMTVDPSFFSNRYVYASYTFNKGGDCSDTAAVRRVNRVSRFTLGHHGLIDPMSERVLFDNIPAPEGRIHSNADLVFGVDGLLYISVGDGGCDFRGDSGCLGSNNAARDLSLPLGKILRIQPDGGLPAGNPFVGPDSSRCNETGFTDIDRVCAEIYAYGLRNPFRMTVDPLSGEILINDVGEITWEEINILAPAADFGWNVREAHCEKNTPSFNDCGTEPIGMTNPILQYGRDEGCSSITGGTFAPAGVWPAPFDNRYLFSDLVCRKIFVMTNGSSGYTRDLVLGVTGFPVDLAFGPRGDGQALYYATRFPDQVRAITYVGDANRTPLAEATAMPNASPAPLAVRFSASGSMDPDGDSLTFDWDFGDGSPNSAEISPEHVYGTPGTHVVTLSVRDPDGATATKTIRVDPGNDAPEVRIRSSALSDRYRLREPLTFEGIAEDEQDGDLPAGSLSWEVLLHHNTHTHTYVPARTGRELHLVAPSHDETSSTTSISLEARVTATDSSGVTTTVSQDLLPVQGTEFLAGPSGLVATRSATFEFISRDFAGAFECSLDEGIMAPCSSPALLNGVSEGVHTFKVQATDSHGHVDALPISRSWKVDVTPPESEILSGPQGPVTTRDATVEFGSTDPDATFECSLDGMTYAACRSPIRYLNLPDGQHTVGVRAKDPAGNIEPNPSGRSWTIDTSPPDTMITESPSGTTASRTARLLFVSTEGQTSFRCSLDGSAWTPCISPSNYQALVDGPHVFAVAAVDGAGNLDPDAATSRWTVDDTAPQIPTIRAGHGNRFTLSPSFDVRWKGAAHNYDVGYTDRAWDTEFIETGAVASRTTETSSTFTGSPGHTYCFRARAYDEPGNPSEWSNESCTTLPIDDTAFGGQSGGVWPQERNARFYFGTSLTSRTHGATLTIPLPDGTTHVEALSEKCRRCGSVRFILTNSNGSFRLGTADLATPTRRSQVLVPVPLTSAAEGNLVIRVISKRGLPVRIDGLAIDRLD